MGVLQSPKIWAIASALKLQANGSPSDAILAYCDDRVATILGEFPDCQTPAALLELMAAMLGTTFEHIRSDSELSALRDRYCADGEFGFLTLEKDLDGEAYGVTYRRMAAATGERPFVSVIDCRGNKGLRSYFTKWHEIGHLLILTDPERSSFRRTHSVGVPKDPEESLVDVIAGRMGFYSRFLISEVGSVVSFDEVDRIRSRFFPEASFQASANAFVTQQQNPCAIVEAKLAYKKEEERELHQTSFGFFDPPTPKLRVTTVIANEAAKTHGMYIPKNFRVPEQSTIYRAFVNGFDRYSGIECLSLWESSNSKRLKSKQVRVEVRQHFDSVLALISECE